MGSDVGGVLPGLPRPDRISIWPLEAGRYGLDATFHGATGYERAQRHEEALKEAGVPFGFRQELGDSWSLRLGPLTAQAVHTALAAYIK